MRAEAVAKKGREEGSQQTSEPRLSGLNGEKRKKSKDWAGVENML